MVAKWLPQTCAGIILSQCENLPEPRLDHISLLEVYRGSLAGCYMQQKCSTLPDEAVIRIGLRVQLTQNSVTTCAGV